jgi:hypothetical protein
MMKIHIQIARKGDDAMAYLNRAERQKLLDELKTMKFNRAKGRLRRLDPKGRIALYRNAQVSGELHTRFELHGLGTVVTLVEGSSRTLKTTQAAGANATREKSEYVLQAVIVEPMPENRT